MTLQTSGPISLGDIQTEFGGSNPISLSEYYDVAAGIPASGTISISDFYGASAFVPPAWDNASVSPIYLIGGAAGSGPSTTLGIRVNDSGDLDQLVNSAFFSKLADYENNGETDRSNLEVRMDYVSGATAAGASTGVWIVMGSSKTWNFNLSGTPGSLTSSYDLRIRDPRTAATVATCRIDVSIEHQEF